MGGQRADGPRRVGRVATETETSDREVHRFNGLAVDAPAIRNGPLPVVVAAEVHAGRGVVG